ncbi:hypothetical protein I8751_08095 [Nostocaceae cyanobacterium CENA357]|uniref:Uncharacterized protein n=1 Tax=Atlanticothrix silvestris CENA357 TaxID=1725252 RepID=A0A8J7KYB0_9CYAN|nr:hypothetical protein [Atlanticothrix silvestris]MBH8552335.1 hypothetical protein [Atlanticothrix silvestris CENA357]
MAVAQLAIAGEDAVVATKALLEIPGISGNYSVSSDTAEREGVTATVATIVGIVGGTIAIAEQIRKWYQDYKQQKSGKRIEKVLIVGRNGRRLLLENATLEEIRQILEG